MDKEKRLEKKIRRQRMVYLAEKVDLEKDPDAKKEWEKLREDLYEGVNPEKRLLRFSIKGMSFIQGIRKPLVRNARSPKSLLKI